MFQALLKLLRTLSWASELLSRISVKLLLVTNLSTASPSDPTASVIAAKPPEPRIRSDRIARYDPK
jgi:hypothetical protein